MKMDHRTEKRGENGRVRQEEKTHGGQRFTSGEQERRPNRTDGKKPYGRPLDEKEKNGRSFGTAQGRRSEEGRRTDGGFRSDGVKRTFSRDGQKPQGDREKRPFRPDRQDDRFKPRDSRAFPPREGGNGAHTAPRPASNAPSAGRRVALETLQDIFQKDGYASLVLDAHLQAANLPQVEKRFCASLVYTSLENLIRIDFALSGFLSDPDSLEKRVRDILRLSVCQVLFMDRVPESAVVDEAVKLTRSVGMESLTGLVNGVLRSFIRGKNDIAWPKPEEGARYLSVMFSVPEWLAQRLLDAYGPETARQICAYRGRHAMTLRPNRTRLSDAQFEKLLEKKVWHSEKSGVLDAWRVTGVSSVARDADYLAGHFSIEGVSSMLAAEAVQARPGTQVLDCCAAPGGKTAYMAESMRGTGRVYAWDVHDHRVALIRAMMKRLGLENIRPAVRDATVLKEELAGQMDAVLLDAPCSGLGVMDDKPDLKYRVTAESVAELTRVQAQLLNTCCRYVRQGGTFVYSTCSLLPEENEKQIEAFLQAHPEFQTAPLPASFPENVRARYGRFGVQILPHLDDGLEGFYIVRMIRL